MEEVQNQDLIEKPKSYKKFVIIGIVSVILILLVGGYLGFKIYKYNQIKKANIGYLKTSKCLTTCPFIEGAPKEGYKNWVPDYACSNACNNKYPFIEGVDVSLGRDMSECIWVETSNMFINCVNEKLDKYSYIIDLSNIDVSVDFERYNITISNAACSNGSAIITLKLNNGKNINTLLFNFDEHDDRDLIQNSAGPVKVNEIPREGETKTYNLNYNNSYGELFKANQVTVSVLYDETLYYLYLDTKTC